MNQRKAKRKAHRIAFWWLESLIQSDRLDEYFEQYRISEEDRERILAALDELTQEHFNKSEAQTGCRTIINESKENE